jgi:hypothetical protein
VGQPLIANVAVSDPFNTRYRGVWVVGGIVGVILLLLGAAGFGLGLAAYIRDNLHHDRTHNHVRAIGFSVAKNDTQAIVDNTTTIVTTWTAEDGVPLYDRTGGFFNGTSGIYTSTKNHKFIATASICWTPTANGTREVRLVTSGTSSAVVFARAVGSDTLSGDQCLAVSQIMDLPRGTMVWVEAFSDSGNEEAVTSESRFSVERIAVTNPT